MKIQDMPAGREMDALVAERVMGWTKSDVELFINRFHPSSEICCAWEVVNKIIEQNWWTDWGCDFFMEYWGDDEWVVCSKDIYIRKDMSIPCVYATAPTLPLAICRAALMAVGGDE